MKLFDKIQQIFVGALLTLIPVLSFAQEVTQNQAESVRDAGISGFWILANISYAGMRAQNNPRTGWRILSFIFGFPGTLISFLAIKEGAERAYGIDLPRKTT